MLIELEGHGREDIFEEIDLTRTVGWFTTIFPVRLRLESEHPGVALKQIKEQLRGIPKRGLGYGVLRYLSDDQAVISQLRSQPRAQIRFNYLGQFDQVFWESSLFKLGDESPGQSQSLDDQRTCPLEINGLIVNGRMRIDCAYSENVHQRTAIEKLGAYFGECLRELIIHCQSPTAFGYTPSDFPDSRLTQEELDRVLERLGEKHVNNNETGQE